MLRIKEKGDELFIKEIPFLNWLPNFFLLSFFVSLSYSFISQYIDIYIPSVIMGLLTIALTCVLLFIFFPVTKIYINKQKQSLTVSRQTLLKNEFEIYFFKDVKDLIFVKEEKGGRGRGINYQLILPLKNGKNPAISNLNGSRESEYFETADIINKYIFDKPEQIPFKLTVLHDD